MQNPFEEIISELKTVRQETADLKALILALKPKDDEFLTPKEVCDFLGIGPTSRWKYEKEGKIKAERIGAKLLYRKSDLEKVLKN